MAGARTQVRRIVAGPHRVGICDECVELARDVALPSSSPATGDLLLTGIGELVTNDPRRSGQLGLVEQAAVAVRHGKVAWVGLEADLPSRYRELPDYRLRGPGRHARIRRPAHPSGLRG